MRRFSIRIILDLILSFAVINGWWFIALPLALVGTWTLPYFLEIILFGLVYDSLFGGLAELGIFGNIGFIIGTLSFVLLNTLKQLVRK